MYGILDGRGLRITHQIVTHRDKTRTEIVWVHHAVSLLHIEMTVNALLYNINQEVHHNLCHTDPVEMVERGSELIELLLADAFSVTGQDLVLHLVDGTCNGGE